MTVLAAISRLKVRRRSLRQSGTFQSTGPPTTSEEIEHEDEHSSHLHNRSGPGDYACGLAQNTNSIEGVWDVAVTVTNCQTGAVIRNVRAIQGFSHDGSFTETASTYLRGSRIGTWNHDGGENYSATYWFFRYTPTGAFASFAYALNSEKLSDDGNHFTAVGTIQDFDATGSLISTGCVVHAATRLAASGQGN